MKKLKTSEVMQSLNASMVSKNRAGNYIARWGYFYRQGADSQRYVNRVMAMWPSAVIIDSGDHFAAFKGGKGVKVNSHFYVEFKLGEII